MREFAFELRLCAHLEADGHLVSRQLGASVARPGNRVIDVLLLEPGPAFDARRAITSAEIPDLAIEAAVGTGQARTRRAAFSSLDIHPETAREVTDRAVDVGFFERERRGGQTRYRQTDRYPEDWFDRLVAIENKPDLNRPGDLAWQLRHDVALGLVDEVVLATESHVTGAHLHRIPSEVGVWRLVDGDIEVVREPTPLTPEAPGTELLSERPGRSTVRFVDAEAKARKRRRMAERAYGKGWRTYDLPGCANAEAVSIEGIGGPPDCTYHDRLVDAATDCGASCAGFEPADPPLVDLQAERERTSPWRAAPTRQGRRQAGLDRYGDS